jgi:hypothetical protein
MTSKGLRLCFALATVPVLVATASVAQNTPNAPDNSTTGETPVSPEQKAHDDEIARLGRQKALSDAQAAARQAQSTAATAALGPLGSYNGADGTVTVTEGSRSVLEATLLSSVALQEAAGDMTEILCRRVPEACATERQALATAPPLQAIASLERAELCAEVRQPPVSPAALTPRALVMVPEANRALVDLAEVFEVRSAALARELCAAMDAADRTTARFQPLRDSLTRGPERDLGGGSIAAVGAIVNAAANLFRSDYTVYGIDLTEDQNLLIRELAGALRDRHVINPIYAPGLFPVSPFRSENPALRRLALLDELRAKAFTAASGQGDEAQMYAAALGSAGERTAEVQTAKAAHETAAKRLEDAIKGYDAMLTALTNPEGEGPPPMSAIIRQAHTAEILRQGGLLVVTNLHFMGGTSYTQRNFFTFLGGMPYHVSGGVLVSYIVEDGQTGHVYDAGSARVAGGYVRPTQLRSAVQGARARR